MKSKLLSVICRVQKILGYFLVCLGGFALILFLLSFTDVPYCAYHSLSRTPEIPVKPKLIVVLGGAGMPSPDGLIRTYYASESATLFADTKIVIALPYNEGTDSLWQLKLMANEMILKGIDSLRIDFEPLGFNTHSQAVNIAKRFAPSTPILIISSPEHMYRSVRTFQKAGFKWVTGNAAFERPVDPARVFGKIPTKDKQVKSLALRYNMWSYLNYELLVLREYSALLYYKIKGWI